MRRARDTLFLLLTAAAGAALATIAGEELLLADMLGRMEVARDAGRIELAEPTWVSLPPTEAIEYFKRKMVMSEAEHDELVALEDRYGARGFYVAGLKDRRELERMHEALTEALERGTTKRDFVTAMRETGLTRHRLETIFDTEVLGAYAAGRYAQMTRPDVLRSRPFWQYKTAGDTRVRPSHQAMHDRVFAADSTVWDTWYPPNGYRCRCSVFSLSKGDLDREGLKVEANLPHELEVDGKVVQMVPDPGFSGSPRVQARADAVVDRIEARAGGLGMLSAPRPAGGKAPGVFETSGDLDRAEDARRRRKVDAFTGLKPPRAERAAREHPFFNIFPAGELGEVPEGETWVEVALYSQDLDAAEQLARRLANQRGLGHLADRVEVAGRASYGDYDTREWPSPEVVWDAAAAARLGLGDGHVFSRATEVVLRVPVRTPEELEAVKRVALQTEQLPKPAPGRTVAASDPRHHPVRRAWEVADIRVRGSGASSDEQFGLAVLNRRPMGAGEQAVLTRTPLKSGGWRSEQVAVNNQLREFLPPGDG